MRNLRRYTFVLNLFSVVLAGFGVTAVQAGYLREGSTPDETKALVDRTIALANQPRFQAAGALRGIGCAGTYIAANTVLTAAHCLYDDDTGSLLDTTTMKFATGPGVKTRTDRAGKRLEYWDGTTYNVVGSPIIHPSFINRPGAFGPDLALLQIANLDNSPVSDLPAIPYYKGSSELGLTPNLGIFQGYGDFRTARQSKDMETSFQKRAGLNVIDFISRANDINPGTDSLGFDLDPPSTLFLDGLPPNFLEYVPVFGDSGGGVFMNLDGALQLVGVHHGGRVSVFPTNLYGTYGVSTRVSTYADWIGANLFGAPVSSPPPGFRPTDPLFPYAAITSEPDVVTRLFTFFANPLIAFFLDPEVTSQVEYLSDSGQTFASVLLPTIGDNLYDLFLFDSLIGAYVDSGIDLVGGTWFDFTGDVDRFLIKGIEGSVPDFTTGLKFRTGGLVNMRQITTSFTDVGGATISEPTPLQLLVSVIAFAGLLRARRCVALKR